MFKYDLKLTFNELILMMFFVLYLLVRILSHFPTWHAEYSFWKISDYDKKGSLPTSNTTLKSPYKIGDIINNSNYCQSVKVIKGALNTVPLIYLPTGKYAGVYCGCAPSKYYPDVVKYKLFKDKVIYLCGSEILEISHTKTFLLDK